MHGLTHLVDECNEHGSLDSFSAFPYENYLKTIKQSLRSGYHSLQQLARKDAETNEHLAEPKNIEGIQLTGNHMIIDSNETVPGWHYKMLTSNKFTLRCVVPDNCFKTKDGSVILLRNNIYSEVNVMILHGQRLQIQNNYYQYPMDSSFGIVLISQLDETIKSWEMNDTIMKCVLIPENKRSYLCIPLAHSPSGIL